MEPERKLNKKLQKVGHNDPSTQQSRLVGIILTSDSQVHQTNRREKKSMKGQRG